MKLKVKRKLLQALLIIPCTSKTKFLQAGLLSEKIRKQIMYKPFNPQQNNMIGMNQHQMGLNCINQSKNILFPNDNRNKNKAWQRRLGTFSVVIHQHPLMHVKGTVYYFFTIFGMFLKIKCFTDI